MKAQELSRYCGGLNTNGNFVLLDTDTYYKGQLPKKI